jgi:hypothetical protein
MPTASVSSGGGGLGAPSGAATAPAAPASSDATTGARAITTRAGTQQPSPATSAPSTGSLGAASPAETDKNAIRAYIERVGQATGVDPRLLVEIGRLESGLRPNAVNRGANSPENKWPKGMFQYRTGTFNNFNAKARRDLPQLFEGLGPPNVMDWRQQAITTAWALRHGYSRRWSTYDHAVRNVGAS